MSSTSRKIIVGCFVMSIITLILNLAMLIARIMLKFTGFDIGTITPSCSSILYLQHKLSSIYVILRADTVLTVFSLTLAIPICIFLFIEMRKPETSEGQQMAFVPLYRIYIFASFQTIFQIANAGSALSLQVDNQSCPIVTNSDWIMIVIIAVPALFFSLTLVILIIILAILQKSVANPEQGRQNKQVQQQEQEMQRKFQQQAKEYLSSNYSQKDEFKQALLRNEHQVYEQPSITQPHNIHNQQQSPLPNKQTPMNYTNQQPLVQDQTTLIKFNNLIKQQRQRKAQQLARQKQLQDETRIKNTLFIINEDNISQKFNQEMFELRQDLDRAIERETQEEFSPLELKQLMQLTKTDFKLASNDAKEFHLEKTFPNMEEDDDQDKYKIRINFAKIKDYKANLNNNQYEEEKTVLKKEEDHEVSKSIAKPEESISEQIKKMLKIILLSNSAFYKQPKHVQEECPISRYVQKDEKLQIIQPNSQFLKNKRIEYSKQQVIYSKKKERIEATESFQKAKIRQQFNEPEALRIQREGAMGKEWVKQKQNQQINQQLQTRPRKRKIVETIRSKFYQ